MTSSEDGFLDGMKVSARFNYETMQYYVYVTQRNSDGTTTVFAPAVPDGSRPWYLLGTKADPGTEMMPAYVFGEDMACDIYRELKKFFEGKEDKKEDEGTDVDIRYVHMRQDYEAERKRVDKLIDYVISPPAPLIETRVARPQSYEDL